MTALDDNFSVASPDINAVLSSLIPGLFEHILHPERVRIIRNDLMKSYFSLSSSSFSKVSVFYAVAGREVGGEVA